MTIRPHPHSRRLLLLHYAVVLLVLSAVALLQRWADSSRETTLRMEDPVPEAQAFHFRKVKK